MPGNGSEEETQSFRLSTDRSDLGVLFLALAFGAVLLLLPAFAAWIMRGILVFVAALLLYVICTTRRLPISLIASRTVAQRFLGIILAISVLSVWLWRVVKGFVDGQWLDAAILTVLVIEIAFLEFAVMRRKPDQS